MELIKEAYYLQYIVIFLNGLDLLGFTILYHDSPSWANAGISPQLLIFYRLQTEYMIYIFYLYLLLKQFPILLVSYYIIQKRSEIKKHSTQLIYLSYTMIGIIVLAYSHTLIRTFFKINLHWFNFTENPIYMNILTVLFLLFSFGILIQILIIPPNGNLKTSKMLIFIVYVIDISVIMYYSLTNNYKIKWQILDPAGDLVTSILFLYFINSLTLFLKSTINA